MTNASEPGERLIRVPAGNAVLEGDLAVPEKATGLVLFAHGSGSSRFSSRNRYVAQELRQRGLGTVLMDLLTPDEEVVDTKTRLLRFDIDLLAARLVASTEWLAMQPDTAALAVGLFGASTGAGAALVAAAQLPERIGAIVSRGGRPDLAGPALPLVKAPTLLTVGGNDTAVIQLNQQAYERMSAERQLVIVPGASHLFEEPGTLEQVARLAGDWFVRYLK